MHYCTEGFKGALNCAPIMPWGGRFYAWVCDCLNFCSIKNCFNWWKIRSYELHIILVITLCFMHDLTHKNSYIYISVYIYNFFVCFYSIFTTFSFVFTLSLQCFRTSLRYIYNSLHASSRYLAGAPGRAFVIAIRQLRAEGKPFL